MTAAVFQSSSGHNLPHVYPCILARHPYGFYCLLLRNSSTYQFTIRAYHLSVVVATQRDSTIRHFDFELAAYEIK